MRCSWINALAAAVGLAASARAQPVNTRLEYEVSRDGLAWASSVLALPGDTIQVRALVSYVGSVHAPTAMGLSQIVFQPVVSGWTGADSLMTQDIDGPGPSTSQGVGPVGGSRSTPIGVVEDLPGMWGRIAPFGASATTTSTFLRGHLGTGTAAGLLRIARANVTNWIGEGATSGLNPSGNTSGQGGVAISQVALWNHVPADLPYSTATDRVVVFRFGFMVGHAPNARAMSISTPAAGIGKNTREPTLYGQQDCRWWIDDVAFPENLSVGSAEVFSASVLVVPSPGGVGIGAAWGLVVLTRRRRPGEVVGAGASAGAHHVTPGRSG
jgi:hypothetical protein